MRFPENCEICHRQEDSFQLFNNIVYLCPDCFKREAEYYDKKNGEYSRMFHTLGFTMTFRDVKWQTIE